MFVLSSTLIMQQEVSPCQTVTQLTSLILNLLASKTMKSKCLLHRAHSLSEFLL